MVRNFEMIDVLNIKDEPIFDDRQDWDSHVQSVR